VLFRRHPHSLKPVFPQRDANVAHFVSACSEIAELSEEVQAWSTGILNRHAQWWELAKTVLFKVPLHCPSYLGPHSLPFNGSLSMK
jgi:hypothetical protein